MRIALAQINPTLGDFRKNRLKIVEFIERARQEKVDLVLFPELALSGYPPEDLLLLPDFMDAMEATLTEIADATKGIAVFVGLARRNPSGEKKLLNSACLLEDGKVVGFQDKVLLPDYDVFSEKRYFDAGGPPKIWQIKGKKIALLICEDMWAHAGNLEYVKYANDPVSHFRGDKVDFVINVSASPFYVGVAARRHQVAAPVARTLGAPLLFVNQVGGNDSLLFDGASFVMKAQGEVVAEAASFQEDLLVWQEGEIHKITRQDPLQLLQDALVRGIADYFRKVGFQKAVLGLSGGIDSALAAAIAVEALGKENVTAFFLPSRYSSNESHEDAREQAALLGIKLEELSIEKPFTCYEELLAPIFKGKERDATEENLQARIRGMLLMAYANKFGALLLATANKSEVAVGFSTLYGDMCGGLMVLGDLTKTQVVALCKWMNRRERKIVERIITKEPTAELREGQKDSDSLPPYTILDQIVEGYVEEHLSPEKIAARGKIALALVKEIVRKIHLNEYKRRQAPPLLRVTKRSFNTGRRFPIAQAWNV